MDDACTCLARLRASAGLRLRAASRGIVAVRTCKHVLFVSCVLCLLACNVRYHH